MTDFHVNKKSQVSRKKSSKQPVQFNIRSPSPSRITFRQLLDEPWTDVSPAEKPEACYDAKKQLRLGGNSSAWKWIGVTPPERKYGMLNPKTT
jgi:hypothetical protein